MGLDQLIRDLRGCVAGDVYGDRVRRGMYATDASIYQQTPVAVVVPQDAEDVVAALAVAQKQGVPVLGRGGGTSLAGQTTIARGIVFDFSRHMNRVVEIDRERRVARVQPGLVRDHLNEALAGTGLMFAPETATSNRATIGGMIGNNSSGMMSIRYGRTSEHVEAIQALLADGSRATLGAGRAGPAGAAADVLHGVRDMLAAHRAFIEERWPRVLRRVGGYSLDELLKPEPHYARFLAGSEGTLALMLECTVSLVPVPRAVAIMAVHFADFIDALRAVPAIVAHDPLSVELVDRRLVRMSRENAATAHLTGFIEGDPAAILFIEATCETVEGARARLRRIGRDLQHSTAYNTFHGRDAADRAMMHELRKAGLGVSIRMVGDAKPVSFIEDACVPVEKLADYTASIIEATEAEGLEWVVYGHASVGVLHFKPVLNLKSPDGLAKMDRLSSRAVELVRAYRGSWSGEHGDGIIRGAKNPQFWGPEMMDIFRDVKRRMDPSGLLNPGKIIDTPPLTSNQRYGPDYRAAANARHFRFRAEGGFHGAVEMCNGTGACRKIGSGTMCPSYMATRDEEHSTRGRANALRLAMSGQLGGPATIASPGVLEALDLCLECKACRTECPSNVDMAKMKSEVLAERNRREGAPIRDRVFAGAAAMASWLAGPQAGVVNALMRSAPMRALLEHYLGISADRTPPPYATETFSAWFAQRRRVRSRRAVGLFVDTYVEHFEPEVGRWFVRGAEAIGYRVVPLKPGCCGRPLISKGFLPEARRTVRATLAGLAQSVPPGLDVVVLEPSCLTALRDDGPDLFADPRLFERVVGQLRSAEQWFARVLPASPAGQGRRPRILVHGHCHQKAGEGTAPALSALGAAGFDAGDIPSGCCGMAGSFGYEAEHFDLSMRIGEDRLFPAIRRAGEQVQLVASGFSCRHQIRDGTGRQAMHLAEAIGRRLARG